MLTLLEIMPSLLLLLVCTAPLIAYSYGEVRSNALQLDMTSSLADTIITLCCRIHDDSANGNLFLIIHHFLRLVLYSARKRTGIGNFFLLLNKL